MNEEEIRSRILICEIRERDYREVGNTKTAERYNQEKYKWEELLNKIDPKNYEKLKFYKQDYIRLDNENKQLKEQLHQKVDIINEITNYCKFQIEKEQDKFPDLLESEKWLKGRISAFVEVLDMECIRNINKYQKDQENNIDLLLNKLQQREDKISKAKEFIEKHNETIGKLYFKCSNMYLLSEIKEDLLKILDNKGEMKDE